MRRCIFTNGAMERSGGGNRDGRGKHQRGARVADRRRARRRRAAAAAPRHARHRRALDARRPRLGRARRRVLPGVLRVRHERVGPAWTTTARLWDPAAVAVAPAVVELNAVSTDTCELTIRPDLPLTPWWAARVPALLDLARAALDELAEELLWQATRDGVAGAARPAEPIRRRVHRADLQPPRGRNTAPRG